MSLILDQVINLDDAERLIGDVCVALTSRRVYGPDHKRSRDAVRGFCKALRSHFKHTSGEETFHFNVEGGQVYYAGLPLKTTSRLLRLAATLERRNCAGLSFRPGIREQALELLLQWLSGIEDQGVVPQIPGISILVDKVGEDTPVEQEQDGEAARFPEFRVPLRIYKTAAESLQRSMEQTRGGHSLDMQEVADLVGCVAEEAFNSGSRLLGPVQLVRDDSFTLQHSVNVFMISTTLLQPFARDAKELALYAQAALLHDIGKSLIPPSLLNKEGKLTPHEEAVMRTHTELGAEILMDQQDVDPLAVEVAYCHHMRDDGSGYPNPELPIRPGPITQVVQVADMFEALTARRPYKRELSVKEAVDVILKTPGMESRRPAISLLMARLTDSPPGSQVVLATGEKATVVSPNPRQPAHPLVEVFEDRHGTHLETPYLANLGDGASGLGPVEKVILRPGAVNLEGLADR